MSALHNWYLNLLKSGEGVRQGLGIPTVSEAAGTLQLGMHALTGDPGARHAVSRIAKNTVTSLGYTATHPFEAGEAILQKIRSDPAGAAGVAVGMALPLGPKAQLRFGQKALTAAERRINARVMRERARVHASLEGPTGPLPDIPVGGAESMGDWAVNAPTELLQRIYKMGHTPNDAIERELMRRGVRPDISGQLHLEAEGPGDVLPPMTTREELGAEMLKDVSFPAPNAQQHARQNLVNFLNTHRPDDPIGSRVGQFLKTSKGWTYLGGE